MARIEWNMCSNNISKKSFPFRNFRNVDWPRAFLYIKKFATPITGAVETFLKENTAWSGQVEEYKYSPGINVALRRRGKLRSHDVEGVRLEMKKILGLFPKENIKLIQLLPNSAHSIVENPIQFRFSIKDYQLFVKTDSTA